MNNNPTEIVVYHSEQERQLSHALADGSAFPFIAAVVAFLFTVVMLYSLWETFVSSKATGRFKQPPTLFILLAGACAAVGTAWGML